MAVVGVSSVVTKDHLFGRATATDQEYTVRLDEPQRIVHIAHEQPFRLPHEIASVS